MRTIEQAAGDVQYEIDMCFKAFELLCRYTSCQPMTDGSCMDPHIDARLFLEAFLVHFRCLIEFFRMGGSGSYPDVRISHYLASAPLRVFAEALEKYKERIDKQLSHISFSRQRHEWDSEQMARDLQNAWNAFIEALPDDRKSLFRTVKV